MSKRQKRGLRGILIFLLAVGLFILDDILLDAELGGKIGAEIPMFVFVAAFSLVLWAVFLFLSASETDLFTK